MNTPRRKKNEEAQKEEKKRYKNATTVSARFEDYKDYKESQKPSSSLFLVGQSVWHFFFLFCLPFFFNLFLFSLFLSPQLKMSSSGKDFDTDGRRRDTEKKKATTTTKDALERALSRHEKYVSSSSEGRFAEDLGIHLLSFVLSLSAVKNELTRKSKSLLSVKRKTEKTRREKSPN